MQPNILYIGSDQHRYDCVGANGHKILKTPNLDKLAAEGIRFTKAFTTCPICTPARVSLLTGQWSFKHGVLSIPEWSELAISLAEGTPTFSNQLKNAGYFMGYVGKWHASGVPFANIKPSPFDLGFEEFIPEHQYYDWAKENGVQHAHFDFNASDNPSKKWGSRVDKNITPEQSKLHWGADCTIDMLKNNANTDKPFFIRWDPSEPHIPNVVPEPYASMYPPEEIELPKSIEDTFEGAPYARRQLKLSWEIEDLTDDDIRRLMSLYYGEISLMDHEIGRVLAELDKLGIADNTLVIYSTDHGDMCGSHRLIDKHFNMFDDITHVPLIMKWKGHIAAGSVSSDYVAHTIDLASTICEAAGAEIPESFQGISLLNAGKTGREDIYSAYHGAHLGLISERMLRNDNYKYIYNATDKDEFYDLKNDPWEMNNLIYSEAHHEIIKQMRLRMAEWMNDTGDTLISCPWIRVQLLKNKKL